MQWSAEAIYARLPAGSRSATTWLAAAACFCRQVVEDLLRVPIEQVELVPWYLGLQVKIADGGNDVLKISHSYVRLPMSELDARE